MQAEIAVPAPRFRFDPQRSGQALDSLTHRDQAEPAIAARVALVQMLHLDHC
jgi:hypothetical protein